jgi:hypothetical protein
VWCARPACILNKFRLNRLEFAYRLHLFVLPLSGKGCNLRYRGEASEQEKSHIAPTFLISQNAICTQIKAFTLPVGQG